MNRCPYGRDCYRVNPVHFQEFSHPPGHRPAPRPMHFARNAASSVYQPTIHVNYQAPQVVPQPVIIVPQVGDASSAQIGVQQQAVLGVSNQGAGGGHAQREHDAIPDVPPRRAGGGPTQQRVQQPQTCKRPSGDDTGPVSRRFCNLPSTSSANPVLNVSSSPEVICLEDEEATMPKSIVQPKRNDILRTPAKSSIPSTNRMNLYGDCQPSTSSFNPSNTSTQASSVSGFETSPTHSSMSSDDFEASPSSNANANCAKDNFLKIKIDTNPYGFFLNNIKNIDSKYSTDFMESEGAPALTLKDIFSNKFGTLVSSLHFSMMVDLDWLIEQYPAECRDHPMVIVTGCKGNLDFGIINLKKQMEHHASVVLCPVDIWSHQTMHIKLTCLRYEEGLRIVLYTGNLVPSDWEDITEGIWVSPLLPELPDDKPDECPTNFKTAFDQFLGHFKDIPIINWRSLVACFDFSAVKVYFFYSVPGSHRQEKISSYGHLKVRQILKGPNGPDELVDGWPFCGVFSSIGSLGDTEHNWLRSEFLSSFIATRLRDVNIKPPMRLVFPSVSNICESLKGYRSGSNFPYSDKTDIKQPYLRRFLHQWSANRVGRTKAMPHMKLYARNSPDNKQLAWVILTSANLSKAAWGFMTKTDGLRMSNYEAGVIFLPNVFGYETFSTNFADKNYFPFPMDLPLVPYRANDDPWKIDKTHRTRDGYGHVYVPESFDTY